MLILHLKNNTTAELAKITTLLLQSVVINTPISRLYKRHKLNYNYQKKRSISEIEIAILKS